jgi:DNA repair exonuclease SbcCD ATPase subunit
MRKFPPWQAGKLSTGDVTLSDGTWISRSWDRKRGWQKRKPEDHKLDFGQDAESNAGTNEPATITVAQAQLESLLGTFELWQRSHVLSSIDALRFSLATDGERKRLAEQVVGLDFDTALKSCRADIKGCEKELITAERERDMAKLQLQGEERRKEAAEAAINRLRRADDKPVLNKRKLRQQQGERKEALRRVEAAQKKNTTAREAIRAEMRKIDSQIGQAKAGQAIHGRTVAKLEGDHCPTCGQAITEQLRLDLLDRAERLRLESRGHKNALLAEREDHEKKWTALGDEWSKLDAEAREIRSELQAASNVSESATEEVSRQTEIADAATEQIRKLCRSLDDHEDDIHLLQRKLEVLRATEKVLGLKGARALVLADVFTSIGEAASYALFQMSSGITLEVSASKVVINGKDYRASGHGVRKKADFALAVALAEVTAAASGRKPGTLWLDEIDDGLDSGEGVSQVAQLIQELARDRCVVVITHSDRLAEEREAVERWDVCDGKVEVRDG